MPKLGSKLLEILFMTYSHTSLLKATKSALFLPGPPLLLLPDRRSFPSTRTRRVTFFTRDFLSAHTSKWRATQEYHSLGSAAGLYTIDFLQTESFFGAPLTDAECTPRPSPQTTGNASHESLVSF